jgi:hypothetical protein
VHNPWWHHSTVQSVLIVRPLVQELLLEFRTGQIATSNVRSCVVFIAVLYVL